MIDRGSDRSVTRQVHDAIAADIAAGTLAPGDPVPSETTLMQRYGIARTTARAAVAMLRAEGAVVTSVGRGSFVAQHPERRPVDLPAGAVAVIRPPTESERRTIPGVRVVEVRAGDDVSVYSADEVELRAP